MVKGTVEEYMKAEGNVALYSGKPCTFLEAGKCSIYPVRPLACRTHHNLSIDEENCKIANVENPKHTPMLNLTPINYAYVDLALQSGDAFADIREFFPVVPL